ncbi:MAG TPA: hypothetical protein VIL20_28935 [Sandaracinaceae bacterium]
MKARFSWLAVLSLLALGCDDGSHHDGAESCQRIIDACHDVDPGTGEAHECHQTAHDEGTAEACDPIEAMCIAVCQALADGGVGHDAGH